MNKMKLSPIWIILVLIALVLGACAPASPAAVAPTQAPQNAGAVEQPTPAATEPPAAASPAEKVTLNLISNWDAGSDPKGKVLQTIVQDFTAANPDIEIKVEIVPDTDMATKIETSFLAKQEPDIILHNWLGPSKDWLTDGVVIPVTPYLAEWGLEGKFKENALGDFTVDSELTAFPIEGFNWPIWYNTEILDKAGVEDIPTTWAELTDAAQKIRAAGFQPFVIGGKDWTGGDWFLTAITAALGNEQAAELFANGGFSQNAGAKAFVEAFVQMRDAGVFADNVEGLEFESMNAMFFEGKAAIVHAGSWSYAELPEALQGKVRLGGIPLPPDAKGATKPFWYSSFEAKGLWITRNGAEKLEAIQKFVQFFFQDQYMVAFVEQTAMVHPFTNLKYDESALSPLFVQSLNLDVDTVEHASVAWAPTNVFDAWYDVTANAFVPGTSAEDILQAMDDLYQ